MDVKKVFLLTYKEIFKVKKIKKIKNYDIRIFQG